jgi:uracil-DNA glycosylase family 4
MPNTRVVPPEGPVDAPLALIGRDTGWQEEQHGRPFVGDAGKVLAQAMSDAGLARSSVLIHNVVPSRPIRDEWALHSDEAIGAGAKSLCDLLNKHPRRCIVGLGAQAFWTCATGEPAPRSEKALNNLLVKRFGGTITELRGYVWDGPFGPVLAAVHPAFVLRSWLPWRATLTWDLQKAKRWAYSIEAQHLEIKFSLYADTAAKARAIAAELLQAPMLAVDSEEPPDACMAFAPNACESYSLLWPRDRECIAELLAAPMPKVLQNAQYDLTKFHNYGLQVNGEIHDTMLAWFAKDPLTAGKSSDSGARQSAKSLRFLASVFTDEPFYKNYNFESPEQKWQLCATDARVTYEIFLRLCPEFAASGNVNEQAWSESQREVAQGAHISAINGSRSLRDRIRAI